MYSSLIIFSKLKLRCTILKSNDIPSLVGTNCLDEKSAYGYPVEAPIPFLPFFNQCTHDNFTNDPITVTAKVRLDFCNTSDDSIILNRNRSNLKIFGKDEQYLLKEYYDTNVLESGNCFKIVKFIDIDLCSSNPIQSEYFSGYLVGRRVSDEASCKCYLFGRSSSAIQWTQVGESMQGGSGDKFGGNIDMNNDGNIVAISAGEESTSFIRVMKYSEAIGEWETMGMDLTFDGEGKGIGRSLVLSEDGMTLATVWESLDIASYIQIYSFDETLSDWSNPPYGIWLSESSSFLTRSGNILAMSNDGKVIGAVVRDTIRDPTNTHRVVVIKLDDIDGGIQTYDLAIGSRSKGPDYMSFNRDGSHIAIIVENDVSEMWLEIYDFSSTTSSYELQSKLQRDEWDNYYASSASTISMSGDGNRIALGFPQGGYYYYSGHVVVYELDATKNEWNLLGSETIIAESSYRVRMSQDGLRIVLGAPGGRSTYYDPNISGKVNVFEYDAVLNKWIQVGQTVFEEDDVSGSSLFGKNVAINGDGTKFVVSAPGFNLGQGLVKVYQYEK
ncbi:hypothetical protein CTEN210_00827 [Chaetoceros tenuissimus]|uniref:Uncharacterized protein n=1 Tax=Chaetoceros tenuissimus TaxID=426638 RepID=A0AAD3CEX6_9STRA|nr:hypothetical protein CTEN210_00827 [Chaetoceros tenuissimus]